MFDKEAQNTLVRPISKKSDLYEQHQKVCEAIQGSYFEHARDAVLEKYLTFCKNRYVDQMMEWRIRVMDLKLTKKE